MPKESPEVTNSRLPAASAIFTDSFAGLDRPISPLPSSIHPADEWFIRYPLPEYVDWRTFTPPPGVVPGKLFARWLLRLTPPGAEVVPIAAYVRPGTREWPVAEHRPFGAPLIVEVAETAESSHRRAERRLQLGDCLPQADYREPGQHAPRDGIPMWAMKTAFMYDLYGYSQLELRDQLEFRDYSSENAGDGSKSVRRYFEEGRKRLAQIGAWPWCMTDKGKPQHAWWKREECATALALWHYQQTLSALGATLVSIECAAGARPRVASQSALKLAERVYREVYLSIAETG